MGASFPNKRSAFRVFSSIANQQLLVIVCVAMAVHILLLIFDSESGFSPFMQGDRSGIRMAAFQGILAAVPSTLLQTMVYGSVEPGEYLLSVLPYFLAGIAGIILFQILITVISVVCIAKIAKSLIPWRWSVLAFGLFYLFLPQNLVFPHQFVTEAIATPFSVFFLYFVYRYLGGGTRHDMFWGGLCLGVAIFSRPSMAFVLPPLVVLAMACRRRFGLRHLSDLAVLCAAAVAPFSIWVMIYTAETGHVGYTDGVATLNWNLRSKVYLVQTANQLPKAPEVQEVKDYADMVNHRGGIGVGRFLSIAAATPAAFFKTAVVDLAIMVGRGNSTKLTVDYLDIANDKAFKGWRDLFEAEGVKGLFRWGLSAGDTSAIFILEGVCSVFTFVWSCIGLALIVVCFGFTRRLEAVMKPQDFGFIALSVALIFAVFLSAELVDRAQARLRNPAEGAMVLLAGLALSYRSRRPGNRNQDEAVTELVTGR